MPVSTSISADDQEAELQQHFIDAVGKLEGIQKQLQRVQQLRRAA